MSIRNKNAVIIQGGASNRRLIARKLCEALDEVDSEAGDVDEDPAVFLILHQLVYLLAGYDICATHGNMAKRYCAAHAAMDWDEPKTMSPSAQRASKVGGSRS